MTKDEFIELARGFEDALVVTPAEGDGTPEIAWGDAFFYHAPDRRMPANEQPYATIVTKNYPEDAVSRLGDGRWRINIHVGRHRFRELLGAGPRDYAAVDTLLPHPLYAAQWWISVVNPGEATSGLLRVLLQEGYDASRARHERRRMGG